MRNLQANTPKTFLTLSAEPDLLPEDALSATVVARLWSEIIEAEAAEIKYRELRKQLTDELAAYIWGDLRAERDPLTPQLQRELAPISESERRALWGDR